MLLDTSMDCLVIGNRLYYKEYKSGLDEGQQVIANYKDFSDGADKLIQGRF